MTSQDFGDPLDHRDPQEKLVSRDSQEPRVTAEHLAEMVWKACLDPQVYLG